MNGINAPFATLFGLPFRDRREIVPGSVVAFGAPVQSTAPRRPGTELGPNAIRETSVDVLQPYLASPSRTVVDLSNGNTRKLRDISRSLDLGDLPCEGQVSGADIEQIAHLTSIVVAAGALPVLLGGDQRVFEGLVRGAGEGATAIVSISDKIVLPSTIDAAALPVASLGSVTDTARPMLCIGANGMQPAAAWDALDDAGGLGVSADTLHETWERSLEAIGDFITQQKSILCCVDLEVLDSGHAAGTPAVNVGGLTPEQLIALISTMDLSRSLAGIAVTNVAPKRDARGLTELAAVEALLVLLDSQLFEVVSR